MLLLSEVNTALGRKGILLYHSLPCIAFTKKEVLVFCFVFKNNSLHWNFLKKEKSYALHKCYEILIEATLTFT